MTRKVISAVEDEVVLAVVEVGLAGPDEDPPVADGPPISVEADPLPPLVLEVALSLLEPSVSLTWGLGPHPLTMSTTIQQRSQGTTGSSICPPFRLIQRNESTVTTLFSGLRLGTSSKSAA